MPHSRSRYVIPAIHKALSHSPIAGVLGQRQVGKTTLVSSLCEEYSTFDRIRDLELAESAPSLFLENRRTPFGIDEAQLAPLLFPALKEWVRIHPRKGQFILTGSVRFTSRKAIRESLTGRIVNIEVLPFTISELSEKPVSTMLRQILAISSKKKLETFVKANRKKTREAFQDYLEKGGLPGICFFRDKTVRQDRFATHLDTLPYRDLQLVLQTTVTPLQLKSLVSFVAANPGEPFSLVQAARASSISTVTIKKILIALEALFLVRSLPSAGSVSKVGYLFEDQGLASFCAKTPFSGTQDILRGIFANLRQEFVYSTTEKGEIFSFRTHDGTDIPLVFKSAAGTVAIIPVDDHEVHQKALASGRSFLNRFPQSKVVFAYKGKTAVSRDFRSIAVPYWWLC